MALEIAAALSLGLLVLWLVFEPTLKPGRPDLSLLEPEAPEETRRGVALLALKEIEFDRETGKLSERDYQLLKSRYGAEALAALEAETARPNAGMAVTGDPEELIAARVHALRSARSTGQPVPPSCRYCGPRPEPGAQFCSRCGLPLHGSGFCSDCGAPLPPESRFCAACGTRVAA
ncbi:MAG TPA: zinc ribbon domain-containing protein [Gemmatimonadales bacterium]|nr:zinc ribbon domain-containing protein [Gemmatimonadales bacterium]